MHDPVGFPWFSATTSLLDLRRQDRVLVAGAGAPAHVRAILAVIGSHGSLMVIEPNRALAEAIAELEHPSLEVLAISPAGSERFGSFDALLSCPAGLPEWPVANYGSILRSNLRPGGRFVLDLPAPDAAPDLLAAWLDAGGTPQDLEALVGPDAATLAEELQREGLRSVHAAFGSHLLDLHSPHDLIALFAPALPAAHDLPDLDLMLARRLKTTGPAQSLVHRTRVHGQR